MATTKPDRLHFTGNDEADELIAREPLALLIGFVLDQQVPLQKAFSSPLELKRRLGSLDAELRKQKLKANIASAKALGVAFAAKAKAAGIASVVFDRSGAPYHGKVKTFADAAREGGLQF